MQTPFVEVPGLLTAECAHTSTANYLAITIHGDLSARTSEIPGDGGEAWGLHRIDMNLFMGNFLELVRSETKAFLQN